MTLVHVVLVAVSASLVGLSGVVAGQELEAAAAATPSAVAVGETVEQVVVAPHAGIDAAVRAHMTERNVVGVAVGVIKAGAITYLKGYGYEDREAQTPLLAERSMLRWASLAKPLTATIAARLAREGTVDLQAPIKTYFKRYRAPRHHLLPCKKRAEEIEHEGKTLPCDKGYADVKLERSARKVTLVGLLGHLSGIMGYSDGRQSATPSRRHLNNPKRNKGLTWGLRKVLRQPFASRPGTAYSYSTFGYNLAAVTMEHATGKDFPTLINEHVSAPSGMTTLQPDYGWADIPHRAAGYRKPKRKRELVRAKTYDVSWKMAGGGLISTPQDLARFCGALMGDTLLTADEKAMLWAEQKQADGEPTEYGLGFGVGERDGRRHVQHAGVQPKARSHLRLYPDEDLCVVVMSNTTTAKTTELVNAIEDAVRAK